MDRKEKVKMLTLQGNGNTDSLFSCFYYTIWLPRAWKSW
jgi:hypothetical protein